MTGLVLLAGQACAAAELWLHYRYFHRPGTAHHAWAGALPRGRQAAATGGLAGYWLAVVALLHAAPAAALAMAWAWVAGYGALLVIRRRSAAVAPQENP